MKDRLMRVTYEIELQPGEQLRLPEALLASIGPGRWRLTVHPVRQPPTRNHAAFLNSYAPEDEGSTMPIQAGDFWVADLPFTSGRGSKKRPVLVLWLDSQDAIVAAVTSALPRSLTDVPFGEWKLAGLRVASTVRLSRLDCLEQTLLIHKLGTISAADALQVKSVWSAHVQPAF